nr:hypothetical protein [Streptomyces violens]
MWTTLSAGHGHRGVGKESGDPHAHRGGGALNVGEFVGGQADAAYAVALLGLT